MLDLAIDTVRRAADRALSVQNADRVRLSHFELSGKEAKVNLDGELSEFMTNQLTSTGIPVVSEEDPDSFTSLDGTVWIIDPLDGSYNYLRRSGPSAVCCALITDGVPVLGVVCRLDTNQMFWGSRATGSYRDGTPIFASKTTHVADSVLFTGFPARMDVSNPSVINRLVAVSSCARKVRMIGSAAISLLHVADGSGDIYAEEGIMPWDVAAGFAIVTSAGGSCLPSSLSSCAPLRAVAGPELLVRELASTYLS